MNVARILYPVKVLGPGNRIGIWLCGCSRGCVGCSNPELWKKQKKYEISVDRLVDIISHLAREHQVDGFTITGGEPFEQAQELEMFLSRIRNISSDILVYTGFERAEIEDIIQNAADVLSYITVLIDGPYIEESNINVALRGSSNQQIHILDEQYSELYESYLQSYQNRIQNFTTMDGIVSVGIHKPGFTPRGNVMRKDDEFYGNNLGGDCIG